MIVDGYLDRFTGSFKHGDGRHLSLQVSAITAAGLSFVRCPWRASRFVTCMYQHIQVHYSVVRQSTGHDSSALSWTPVSSTQ